VLKTSTEAMPFHRTAFANLSEYRPPLASLVLRRPRLTKLGVKLRIIDKAADPGTTSRALAVHARTLELYRQLDLADFFEP
jgi:hypothetical protein